MKSDNKGLTYPSGTIAENSKTLGEDHEDLITLRELITRIWRGRVIIATTTLVSLVVTVGLVTQLTPKYRATASVMFAIEKANVIDLQQILTDPEFSKDTLQNEVEVLQSTSLMERVVNELKLRNDPEFALVDAPGLIAQMRQWIPGLDRLSQMIRAAFPTEPPQPLEEQEQDRRELLDVIDQLRAGLVLQPITGTRVIEISYSASRPRTAAKIVNTIADQYIVDQLVGKMQTTRSAVQWLSGRVDDARGKVQQSEEAVETLRAKLSESAGQSLELTEQQLGALNAALSSARANTAQIEAHYDRLSNALAGTVDMAAITEFRDSALIREYRATESELMSRLEALSQNHPARPSLETQLREVREKIRGEAAGMVAAMGIDLAAARAQVESLAESVRRLETKGLGQSRDEVQLHQLEREAEANRQIYETMLNRLKETSEQVDLQEANARVLSPAEIPRAPENSRKKLIVAMAGIMGLLTGIGVTFLREHLNDTFRTSRVAASVTHLPVLATIPSVGPGRRRGDVIRQLREAPNSTFSEAIRNLRTSILASGTRPPKVVLFTSSVPGEGKSTTAVLTALASRQMGKTSIILDCDLRQPATHQTIRADPMTPGLVCVLKGAATLEEAIQVQADTGLHLLKSRRGLEAEENAGDLLASDELRGVIEKLSGLYDMVILDTPPTLVVSDARILSAVAEAVVYVVRWNKTEREAVLEGLRGLAAVNAPLIGTALTLVNETRAIRTAEDSHLFYRDRYRNYYRTGPDRRRNRS